MKKIVHDYPKEGFYYWVKLLGDYGYKIALAVKHQGEILLSVILESDFFYSPTELDDWKKEPIKPFNEGDYEGSSMLVEEDVVNMSRDLQTIEFAMHLTGHDEGTIKQMFFDYVK